MVSLADFSETRVLHRALRVQRIVLVTSLVYGTDNSGMVDALRQLGHWGKRYLASWKMIPTV